MTRSFLDTLPEAHTTTPRTHTPTDRITQLDMLVRWQAQQTIRLDDLLKTLDERVRAVDASLDALSRWWDLLAHAKLAPDRHELMVEQAQERLGFVVGDQERKLHVVA